MPSPLVLPRCPILDEPAFELAVPMVNPDGTPRAVEICDSRPARNWWCGTVFDMIVLVIDWQVDWSRFGIGRDGNWGGSGGRGRGRRGSGCCCSGRSGRCRGGSSYACPSIKRQLKVGST
jgi:hypothetical protein